MSDNQDHLYAMRHSLAHIMATAIQKLWPEAKFGVGPVVENGFYYDVDLGETKLSDEDHATFDDPCPKCGNTATVSYPQGQEFAMRAGGIAVTSKPHGGGKWPGR